MKRADGDREIGISMEPVIVRGFDVALERQQVERMLGRKATESSMVAHRLVEVTREAIEAARTLVEPKGIYLITSGSSLGRDGIFAHLDRIALCVCTIGEKLEERVADLQSRGELLRAFVLDAVGSAAAEETANVMERLIAEEAALRGLAISCRASPGYGDWDVGEQRKVFELVPAERIDVRLSQGCMMIPRKSVSFAVHMAKEPARLRSENSCSNCDRRDCPYRDTEVAG